MDRPEYLDREFVDGEGVVSGDARSEVVMVLTVTLSLFFLAVLMWFAIAGDLFGTDGGTRPSSPSIPSPDRSSTVSGGASQSGSSGLSINFGSMTPDQAKSYIQTQDPNVNASSWPKGPVEPQSSITIPTQGTAVNVRVADPVPFDFGEMTGEPWSPPEARGSVTLDSLSTQGDSVLQVDGVINYQLSVSIDDATDGPISIVVRAENATFPASQCFSAAPLYDGMYPPDACTVQTPDTSGFLPLAAAIADGTGSTVFNATESRLIYTFRPRTSGTYLFDFSATVPQGLPGDHEASRSVIATAQVFRGAVLMSTLQVTTDLAGS